MNDNLISNDQAESLLVNNNERPKIVFTGENIEDKQLLYEMGFDYKAINTIYNNMHPGDLQEALDYLNKNDKGKYTHSYLVNERFVCAICGEGRYSHESDALFVENNTPNPSINPRSNTSSSHAINSVNNVSDRFRRYESSYRNSLGKTNENKYKYNYSAKKECGICGDEIESSQVFKTKLKCNHTFCMDCWLEYLKEKINNANVVKISCMQNGCGVTLDDNFIKKILGDDNELIAKYDKFSNRKKLMEKNEKIRFCPHPDCEGYAEKTGKNKYVKCNFGHEFCFECSNPPHGKKKCSEMLDKEFEEWKSHKIIKRCPCCRMWTEKNEGCNHMTCVECKFQWCWLCQKRYTYDHFDKGACTGLQFYKEDDQEKIKKKLEENKKLYPTNIFCTILTTFGYLLMYIFLIPYLILIKNGRASIEDSSPAIIVFYALSFFPFFICYEVFSIIFTLLLSIPALFYPPYFRKLRIYIFFRLLSAVTAE